MNPIKRTAALAVSLLLFAWATPALAADVNDGAMLVASDNGAQVLILDDQVRVQVLPSTKIDLEGSAITFGEIPDASTSPAPILVVYTGSQTGNTVQATKVHIERMLD